MEVIIKEKIKRICHKELVENEILSDSEDEFRRSHVVYWKTGIVEPNTEIVERGTGIYFGEYFSEENKIHWCV